MYASLKRIFSKHKILLFSFIFFFAFSGAVSIFAADWPYAPGATLNPGCAPGADDCNVTISSGGTPGGADTYVQYNDGGVLGGDSNFTWDKNLKDFIVGDVVTVGGTALAISNSLGAIQGMSPNIQFGDINTIGNGTLFSIADVNQSITASVGAHTTVETLSFDGVGLDDMASGGTYTGVGVGYIFYTITIDSEGSPDTFTWTDETITEINVPITGSEQTLSNGVTITFGATTGHTSGDQWYFAASSFSSQLFTNSILAPTANILGEDFPFVGSIIDDTGNSGEGATMGIIHEGNDLAASATVMNSLNNTSTYLNMYSMEMGIGATSSLGSVGIDIRQSSLLLSSSNNVANNYFSLINNPDADIVNGSGILLTAAPLDIATGGYFGVVVGDQIRGGTYDGYISAGMAGDGIDAVANDLFLQGGASTGTADGGEIHIRTTYADALSGSTLNDYTDVGIFTPTYVSLGDLGGGGNNTFFQVNDSTQAITFGYGVDTYTFPIGKGSAVSVLTDVVGDGTLSWENLDTSMISENGSALFYTDNRARSALALDIDGIDYNSSTGVFSLESGYTIPLDTSVSEWSNAYDLRVSSWTSPLSFSSGTVSMMQSSALTDGYLSATDWGIFNDKQNALGFTPEDISNKSTNVSLGTSNSFFPTQNAVKTYVDNLSLGLKWHSSVVLVNVIADTDTPVGAPNNLDAYIINTGGDIGDWVAFDPGDLIQYQEDHWELIKSLEIGDRFGVSFKSSLVASGAMLGKDDYLAQVTGGISGAFSYTFEAPENNDAVLVENANAYYGRTTFTYSTDVSAWVQLSASVQFSFTNGLTTLGSTVSLGTLTSDWNQIGAFNINTAGDISLSGGDLTTSNTTASLFNTNATTLNIGGDATSIGIGAAGATIFGAGALDIMSGAVTALTLDSGTTGAVNLGTGANSKTINIGNDTSGTQLNLFSGTGNMNLQIAGTGLTGNIQVGVGGSGSATPDLFVLDTKNTTGDPTGVNGAMYYNSDSDKFRCYGNDEWKDCTDTVHADTQNAASYDTSQTLQNVGSSQVTITSLSVTPTTAAGDVYVRGKVSIVSSNSTDQSLVLSIEDNAICTGSTLVTNTISITSNSGSEIGDFEIAAIDVDAGASLQSYSLCASTATGDTDIRLFQMFATVIDTGADVAEIYTTNDESLEAGDVVSIDSTLSTGVKKSMFAKDRAVIGIVSTNPGSLIGGVEKEGVKAVPVALAGRVPVKVSTENGIIEPGDYITPSSIAGVAMKSDGNGLVVGQSITAYSGDGVGTVLVFIKNFDEGDFNSFFRENISLGYSELRNALVETIAMIQTELVRDPISIISEKVTSGVSFFVDFVAARVTAIRGYFNEVFTKKITTEEFCINDEFGENCVTLDRERIDKLKEFFGEDISDDSEEVFTEENPDPISEENNNNLEVVDENTEEEIIEEQPTEDLIIIEEEISTDEEEPPAEEEPAPEPELASEVTG